MDDKDKITLDRETFRALAADSRIDILKMLDEHKLTLTDLTQKLDMSPSTIKEHLDRLTAAGLIELIPGETKWKYYKLTRKGKNVLNPYETKVWFALAVTLVALFGVVYNLLGKIMSFNTFLSSSISEKANQGGMMLAYEQVNRSLGEDAVLKTADVALDAATTTISTIAERGEGLKESAFMLSSGVQAPTLAEEAVNKSLEFASSTTTTLAEAIRSSNVDAISALPSIPMPEILLAIFLAAAAGLCIGYLLKKKRRF